eukprot:4233556-Prymnesium_polylepis.1
MAADEERHSPRGAKRWIASKKCTSRSFRFGAAAFFCASTSFMSATTIARTPPSASQRGSRKMRYRPAARSPRSKLAIARQGNVASTSVHQRGDMM